MLRSMEVQLKMAEDEARWLRACMQTGQAGESIESFGFRQRLWNSLNDAFTCGAGQ